MIGDASSAGPRHGGAAYVVVAVGGANVPARLLAHALPD